MKKNGFSVKTVVAIGIGAAVFVILGRFVSIPTGVANTSIETTYPFLALMASLYGPVAGFLIGLIGHTIKDATAYGSPWWSWVICSGIIGLIFGLVGSRFDLKHGEFKLKQILSFNLVQVVANYLVWALVAPSLDILIYSEPANKVYLQGIVSATANAISVAILGTLLLKAYAATRTKKRLSYDRCNYWL